MTQFDPVRAPAVAGQFYPGSATALRDEVDALLDAAEDARIGERTVAFVAPHAGYAYSGPTAALAWRQVRGQRYDAVILIAPSHHDAFPGVSLMAHGGYATPLGTAPIHTGIAERLLEVEPDIREMRLGHQLEHAVEVQLPFLQRALGDVPIVPLVMLDRSWKLCRELAEAIAAATKGMRVLVVASSDLYHGYSEVECGSVDEATLRAAEMADPEIFCRDLDAQRVQACGGGPIAVAKAWARLVNARGARVLAHTTSAEATGRNGGYVVGYGAVAYYRLSEREERDSEEELAVEDRVALLDLAKAAIRAAVSGKPAPRRPADRARLLEARGAFVTLTRREELRGCIGQVVAMQSLAETVIVMAVEAALRDPRFLAVKPSELDEICVEISALSPFRPISHVDEIVVGWHGLMIFGRGRRGLLLPQVATRYGWSREEFLRHTCLKAGLPPGAWCDGDLNIEVFTADVFGDDRPIGRVG